MDPENHSAAEIDDTALENWKRDALERRSTRKQKGARGAWAAFREWPLWQQSLVLVPAIVISLVLVGGAVDAIASAGRIHPGVEAAGIPVGGLDVEAARVTIAKSVDEQFHLPVKVSYETTATWDITAAQLGAAADTTAAAEAAFAVGREGGMVDALSQRVMAWFTPVEVGVPVSVDTSMTTAVLDGVAKSVNRDPLDATIVIEDLEPVVVSAVPGVAMRRSQLENEILTALTSSEREVEVAVDTAPVRITDEGARAALPEVRAMLAGPVEVTHEAEKWQFSAQEIAGWLAFRPRSTAEASASVDASLEAGVSDDSSAGVEPEAGSTLEAFIDTEKATETIGPKVGGAGTPAVDATFKVSAGSVSIVPSQDGVGPDIDALVKEMTLVLKGPGARSVELRTQRVEPDVTTEEARGMGIKERLGTYTTTYSAGNKPRVNNIHTLADAIDGALIPPGGTFSFNGTVGPRTAAKGYQEAPAIVNGELVPQLGGGICQVGTTVFNAVFESGLPVVERHNHSLYISHYPKGRDATVSWGGPDLKFRNDTENWVMVATGYSNSSLTISLYGTDPGYEVSASTGPWTNIRAHTTKEVPDPTLAIGKRVIEETGADGRSIVVTRTVRKNGAVVREDNFKSVYKTEQEVVRVGTMPVSTAPSATVTTP